jgi:hypothetical protein
MADGATRAMAEGVMLRDKILSPHAPTLRPGVSLLG